MKPLPLLLFLVALSAGGSARAQAVPDQAPEQSAVAPSTAHLPSVDLTPRLLYGFLLAEIAGQSGMYADSGELYSQLAQETRDPRVARRAAEIGMYGRRPDAALQAARLWLELEPDSAQARHAVLGLLSATGRFDELKGLLPGLLAAEPQSLPQNLLGLHRLFARGGDRKQVREIVDFVTAPHLALPEAHFVRAQAALDAGDSAAARRAINRALEIKPDWDAAALLRAQLTENRAEALIALDIFLAANPAAHDVRLAYARLLAGEKRYTDARREFRLLLERSAANPARNGDLVFAVAVLSLQLNDTVEAETQLRKLVELGHPEADKARYFLGQIAAEAKRHDEAISWFVAIGRGEHYLPARQYAAGVLARQGKLDAARAMLHSADSSSPRERVQLLVAESQLLREAGKPVEAHGVLAAALAQQPDHPELLYETALLAEKIGRLDELETRLRRLLEINPEHAHALNALGFSLAERNIRLGEAKTLIERALALAPNDPFILDSKGWVLFRQGEALRALEYLQRAFGIRRDPEIAAHIGEVLWSLGRRDEAQRTWEEAHKEFPGSEALAATVKRLTR